MVVHVTEEVKSALRVANIDWVSDNDGCQSEDRKVRLDCGFRGWQTIQSVPIDRLLLLTRK